MEQQPLPFPDDGISPYWAARAAEFHLANPHVYQLLVKWARRAKRHGAKRVGIEMIWNLMRWQAEVVTRHPGDFKLNQNYKAWYARLIMQREPDLVDIFETRRRR
jgi:hypothetical protein